MIVGVLSFILDGKRENLSLEVGSTIRVGRSKENDLVVESTAVSRFHSTINVTPEGALVSDLGSTNGTYINGLILTSPGKLKDGDRVSFGAFQSNFTTQKDFFSVEDYKVFETQATVSQLRTKLMNLVLIDVISYTVVLSNFPPSEVSEILIKWIQHISELVGGYRGAIDKQLGDRIVATWELVDLEKAANCAEKVIHETILFAKREWKYEKQHPWRCRVVGHQGKAIIGVGGANRNTGISGEAIIEAKKLADLAGEIKSDILLSESFAKKLPPNFGYMELDRDGKKLFLKNLKS